MLSYKLASKRHQQKSNCTRHRPELEELRAHPQKRASNIPEDLRPSYSTIDDGIVRILRRTLAVLSSHPKSLLGKVKYRQRSITHNAHSSNSRRHLPLPRALHRPRHPHAQPQLAPHNPLPLLLILIHPSLAISSPFKRQSRAPPCLLHRP